MPVTQEHRDLWRLLECLRGLDVGVYRRSYKELRKRIDDAFDFGETRGLSGWIAYLEQRQAEQIETLDNEGRT